MLSTAKATKMRGAGDNPIFSCQEKNDIPKKICDMGAGDAGKKVSFLNFNVMSSGRAL